MAKTLYSVEQKKIVEKLLTARLEAKLSQIEAAQKLGKSQSYISKVESGQRLIDIVELKQFSALYNKPINYFID